MFDLNCTCDTCTAARTLPSNKTPPADAPELIHRAANIARAMLLAVHDVNNGKPSRIGDSITRREVEVGVAGLSIIIAIIDDFRDLITEVEADTANEAADTDTDARRQMLDLLARFAPGTDPTRH